MQSFCLLYKAIEANVLYALTSSEYEQPKSTILQLRRLFSLPRARPGSRQHKSLLRTFIEKCKNRSAFAFVEALEVWTAFRPKQVPGLLQRLSL